MHGSGGSRAVMVNRWHVPISRALSVGTDTKCRNDFPKLKPQCSALTAVLAFCNMSVDFGLQLGYSVCDRFTSLF